MKGTIKEIRASNGNPYCYIIEGDDEETYYAHIGDVKSIEDLLYIIDGKKEKDAHFLDSKVKDIKLEVFKDNERIEFEIFNSPKAIHVKKQNPS